MIKNDLVVAQQIFNLMLHDGIIKRIISNMPKDMEYINVVPVVIADLLDSPKTDFYPEVKLWKPWNRWFSKAYATTYTGNYEYIGLNLYKLNRPIESLVGSIAHEWGHCLEYKVRSLNLPYHFNHGDNERKDNTFQYQLGIQAKAYVKEYKDEFLRRLAIVH